MVRNVSAAGSVGGASPVTFANQTRCDYTLRIENLPSEFDAEYDRIFGLWTDEEMSSLAPAERDFIIANVCLNQSLNGGLMMYYENSYGDRAQEAVEVFGRIGLPRAASVLKRANRLMGAAGPSKDRESRGTQLDALSDFALEQMYECSDALNAMRAEVMTATLRWVRKHARP